MGKIRSLQKKKKKPKWPISTPFTSEKVIKYGYLFMKEQNNKRKNLCNDQIYGKTFLPLNFY